MLSRGRLVRLDWGNIDCRLTTISSMPVPEKHIDERLGRVAGVDLDGPVVKLAFVQEEAQVFARAAGPPQAWRDLPRALRARRPGMRGWALRPAPAQYVEQALLGILPGTWPRTLDALLHAAWTRAVSAKCAPWNPRRGHVAHLGELGRLRPSRRGRPPTWPGGARSRSCPPVGPMSMMFLGEISSRMGGGTCCRRQRLRRATATARLASALADDVAIEFPRRWPAG